MLKLALSTTLMVSLASLAFAADPALSPTTAPAPARVSTAITGTGDFLTRVSANNMFEIESGKLALAKSGSEAVKDLARTMVTEHTDAATRFKQVVGEAMLFTPPDALDARHRAILDELVKKDGPDFDKAWLDAQSKTGQRTVVLLQAYADGGDNARMKQYAQELLPALKKHLEAIDKLKS